MIAADTCSLIAFFAGEEGRDVLMVEKAIEDNLLVILPPVLSEMLSDPYLPKQHEKLLTKLPSPELREGYWERVGYIRRSILKKKKRARLADALICQFCLDHGFSLITRDSDFQNFKDVCKLNLI